MSPDIFFIYIQYIYLLLHIYNIDVISKLMVLICIFLSSYMRHSYVSLIFTWVSLEGIFLILVSFAIFYNIIWILSWVLFSDTVAFLKEFKNQRECMSDLIPLTVAWRSEVTSVPLWDYSRNLGHWELQPRPNPHTQALTNHTTVSVLWSKCK